MPWFIRIAVVYAPSPKNAAVANEGYPVSPPMKFQLMARIMYMRMSIHMRVPSLSVKWGIANSTAIPSHRAIH